MSDQRLRTALRELGDVPAPADLASAALTRARRDRRRAGVALAAAVVLATAAAILVPATLRTRAEAPPAAPAPTPTVWIPWYQTGTRGMAPSQTFFYDPASHGYRATPRSGGGISALSPDGRRAVVTQTTAGRRRMAIVGLDRVAAGLTEADWSAAVPVAQWQWSPDGTRLLSTDDPNQPTEARVLDVETRVVTRVPLGLDELIPNARGLAWGPGGDGFVTWRTGPVQGRPGGELVVFDGAGRPTRRYPLPATAGLVRLTPNGQRALLMHLDTSDPARHRFWILDLRTGTTTAVPARGPADWYDERHLLRLDVPASGPSALVVLDAYTQRIVRRSVPPVAGPGRLTGLLLARGVAPAGAIVP